MSTSPHFLPPALAFLASSAALLFAGAANAGQSCAADAQCPNGFSCQVVGGTACAGYACPPGVPCPPQPPCEPMDIKECRPGPCTTDADCATGMVCFSETQRDCPPTAGGAPSCPPGVTCPAQPPEPAPAPCTTTTVHQCVPRYALPCTLDINCGDGFTCVPDQCGCAVSGGTGGGFGGSAGAGTDPSVPAPEPTPPPDCSCPAPTTSHCEPRQIVCTTANNCPSQWSCVATRTGGGTCAGEAPTPGNPNPPPPVCTPDPVPPNYCMPPYYDLGFGSSADQGSGTFGSAGSGAGATSGEGAPQAPGTGTGGTTGTDHKASAAGSSSSNDSGGCQMSASHTGSSASALLALLGFVGLARRRRAHASA
jgi:MYXO-CTERM domain-containing protein